MESSIESIEILAIMESNIENIVKSSILDPKIEKLKREHLFQYSGKILKKSKDCISFSIPCSNIERSKTFQCLSFFPKDWKTFKISFFSISCLTIENIQSFNLQYFS